MPMIFGCSKKLETRVEFINLAYYCRSFKCIYEFSEKKSEFEIDYPMAIQNIWLHRKEVPNQAHSGIDFYDYKSAK